MRAQWLIVALASLVLPAVAETSAAGTFYGRLAFGNPHEPPSFAMLDPAEQARYELGGAVFNTQFVVAGTPGVTRHAGLGPRFNAAACDGCHNSGARARANDAGLVPAQFVMQLDPDGARLPAAGERADRRYGHALNTATIPGFEPEARLSLRYRTVDGRYSDGEPWSLRAPDYAIAALALGSLPPDLVLRPRIAPAVFGAGLLARVPQSAIVAIARQQRRGHDGVRGRPVWRLRERRWLLGRFGWQAAAVSLDEQTARALSRDMGLSSRGSRADCGISDGHCLAAPAGGDPEVADDLFDALLAFQTSLAVPEQTARPNPEGQRLFAALGCAGCHRPSLPIDGGQRRIDPYSDLLLHDLGPALDDRTVSGRRVRTLYRTAPLWGLGRALQREPAAALLHDGRARTVAEAVLWHDGEARRARRRFIALPAAQRAALIAFVASR